MASIRTKAIAPFTSQKCVVACSGGVDSVALLHFMASHNEVTVVHINHNPGNDYDDKCEELVKNLAATLGVVFISHHITEVYTSNIEHQWRTFRQKIFRSFECDVYLAHTLDDQVEEYVMSMLKGNPRFIAPHRNNLRRPFLFLTKKEIYDYAIEHNLKWHEDPTNFDGSNQRSICRSEIIPQALKINPGLYKTVTRLAKEQLAKIV